MSKSFKVTMALIALIVGVFSIFVIKAMKDKPVSTSAAVVEPVKSEPAPSMMPTIHTDPEMALHYANMRLESLKRDYARNEKLYQNKDADGLSNIRGELIEAMNDNKYDYPSEMRFFIGCDQAHQALVFLNAYYTNESDLNDGHDLEKIAKQELEYADGLAQCEENIQSSIKILNEET